MHWWQGATWQRITASDRHGRAGGLLRNRPAGHLVPQIFSKIKTGNTAGSCRVVFKNFRKIKKGCDMVFNEYQKDVLRTADKVTASSKDNMLFHGIIGANGEAGELADLLKKHIFHGHPFDREHCIRECGDVLYYLALIAESLDTTLEEVATVNCEKRLKRYPEGFSLDKSLYRKEEDI